jgi:hypothetical protein
MLRGGRSRLLFARTRTIVATPFLAAAAKAKNGGSRIAAPKGAAPRPLPRRNKP